MNLYFFFQAEDGIRDYKVTGVQTCALPIYDMVAYTPDQSGLYGIRLTLAAPGDHVVLPEIISKEPLGPAVRQGDDQWFRSEERRVGKECRAREPAHNE